MKKYSIVLLMVVSCLMYGQVTIGKTAPSSNPANTSVSIEFGNATGGNKGIVMPWVTSAGSVATPALGTIIFDSSNQTFRYRRIISGSAVWDNLSLDATTPATASVPDSNDENGTAKALIGGDPADATPGVLVLAATDKAMVLPRVSAVSDIARPSAGMMVFITGTAAAPINQLAVYNGSEWAFWRSNIGVVVSPTTGKVWMDRNLGAMQVAANSTDALALGDLYQWGRLADGHQTRNSLTVATQSTTDVPGNSNFITNGTAPSDWRNPQNNNLWQGVNGVNNPCPLGFRLPTIGEFQAETAITNSTTAMSSPLKLPLGGTRSTAGVIGNAGTTGNYYTSTVPSTATTLSSIFTIASGGVSTSNVNRATGASVRCIKN